MYRPYADYTCDKAVGNANKEWKTMARLALKLRKYNCTPAFEEENLPKFTGIYKRLLTDPIEEIEAMVGANNYV